MSIWIEPRTASDQSDGHSLGDTKGVDPGTFPHRAQRRGEIPRVTATATAIGFVARPGPKRFAFDVTQTKPLITPLREFSADDEAKKARKGVMSG